MDVTDRDVARIPPRNLRVPRDEFVAVWRSAEHALGERNDWYSAGVAVTCRWLANATVRPVDGPWRKEPAPVTRRRAAAYEELVDAEYVAAEKLLLRRPPDVWIRTRPGYVEAVVATLVWAWRHRTGPPLSPVGERAAC